MKSKLTKIKFTDTVISADKVTDLDFVEIVDPIDDKWVVWFVTFVLDGVDYEGSLDGCPNHPEIMHHNEIVDIAIPF